MYASDQEGVKALVEKYAQMRAALGQVIVGQQQTIQDLAISIFSQGHCLLIGVPGLAKTLLVNTVSDVLGLSFKRIQFTPDLMPSDITGAEILAEDRSFRFVKGPLFAHVVLADEINRTPPKTQAALLEAMQEKAVTVSGTSYALPQPFFVLATQNPIEQEGTYPLPEAQLDRFMLNIMVDYPSFEEEVDIVRQTTSGVARKVKAVLTEEEILYFQGLIRRIPVTDHVLSYAVKLSSSTRPGREGAHPQANAYLSWGAGPRASQFLVIGAKCHAALQGKFAPDEADVRAVAHAILRHRIVRNYKAEAEGISVDDIISKLL